MNLIPSWVTNLLKNGTEERPHRMSGVIQDIFTIAEATFAMFKSDAISKNVLRASFKKDSWKDH